MFFLDERTYDKYCGMSTDPLFEGWDGSTWTLFIFTGIICTIMFHHSGKTDIFSSRGRIKLLSFLMKLSNPF